MAHENRLAGEQSPYLLQHRHNPVDWFPWGAEAFEKARAEDKPIFLSIGYSTCHWCHVMERESFEDEEVARLMNEAFVSIKVDREERPDIDGIYMTVCQMMTGHGGWPLTILMTPDRKPFYAATYIPKHSRYGHIGMVDLIPRIRAAWDGQRGDVVRSAEEITGALQQAASFEQKGTDIDPDWLHLAFQQLAERYDPEHGGFGTAPKFPTPHNLLFLLRYWKRTGEQRALRMAVHTLARMRLGGIYDHVGFGFHRYATDAAWLLPHFEKMLYDQALLATAYVEAFLATGDPAHEATAREIFAYVLRDMTAPEGGFYSAEDADSEGQEGKFYLWTLGDVRDVLGPEAAQLVIDVYNLEPEGNFEDEATRQKTGENILYLDRDPAQIAVERNTSEEGLREHLEAARQQLFAHREERVHPGKDDKILTDWNGLMIAALAKAAQAFDEPAYLQAARRAADFLLERMRDGEGRLLHRYRGGEAGIQANIDDYAFLIWGLLELYEASFEVERLEAALDLNEQLLAHFWDEARGGFFFTPDDGEALIVRQKEFYDGAVPSGNSVAMLNLLRLARITGEAGLEEKAAALGRFAAAQVRQAPMAYTAFLLGVDFAVGPAFEVVIAGRLEEADTRAMLAALRRSYVPNKVVLFRPAGEAAPAITRVAPFVQAQQGQDGHATAYVCQAYVCQAPTTQVAEMLERLGA